MKPECWRQVEKIYNAALEHRPAERGAFLQQACAGDESVRKEVESLLGCDSGAEDFIERPAIELAAEEVAMKSPESYVGRTLLHFSVDQEIGRGGMGVVYRARDINLNRPVAIKVLPEAFAEDRERLARFKREARLLASLSHPNVATIHGLEESEGRPFLVFELVEGKTLAERLRKGPLDVAEALEICRQIAEGLEAAHEKGVIHRDLKPANVKITPEGKVKILDFGLARAFWERTSEVQSSGITAHLTAPGAILGTPAYVSPEQAAGRRADRRTDVWAFGCILFECLTGKRAFPGETVSETLAAVMKDEPDWSLLPRQVPERLCEIMHRCLRKDAHHRYQHIGDVRLDLLEIKELPESDPTRILLHSRLLAGVISALLFVATAVALVTWYFRPMPSRSVARSVLKVGPGLWLDGGRLGTHRPTRTSMAFSSNGEFVVYSAIRENPGPQTKPQIYLRKVDQIEAAPVPGTEGGISPFLSPDDRWIGFWEGGKLKKISISGGLPVTLCEAGPVGVDWPHDAVFGADWGPGNRIVFCPKVGLGLSWISADGGSPEALTAPDETRQEYDHRLPHYLPGGRGVLFTVTAYGHDLTPRLALLDLETRQWQVLTDDAADGRYLRTGHLVFVRQGSLTAVPFDIDRRKIKGRPVPIVANVMQALNVTGVGHNTGAGQYCISDSGWLAYVPGGILPDSEDSLVLVDEKGKTQPAADWREAFFAPRLSPDGRRIAYSTLSRVWQVKIYDLRRGTATPLTTEGRASRPTWTPDGKRLVMAWSKSVLYELWWQGADGSPPMERLAPGFQPNPGSFTPDGSTLAFVDYDPQTGADILLLDMRNRRVTPFLHSKAAERYPEISPKGQWLAYVSGESGRAEVWVRPFPGAGGKWQISNAGGTEPIWSKDGKRLFYRQSAQVRVADVRMEDGFSDGKPRLLFEQPGFRFGDPIRNWDLAPDGRSFLMVKTGEPKPEPVTEMILVQNWFEELERLCPTEK